MLSPPCSATSAERLLVAAESAHAPTRVKVESGALLQLLEAHGHPFARFTRALRMGLGNRHQDPLVDEALRLFPPSFRKLGMKELLEIARKLRRLFGDGTLLAESFGGPETVDEGERAACMRAWRDGSEPMTTSAWRLAWLVAKKDLRIERRSHVALNQVLPFSVIVMVMFAFALERIPGPPTTNDCDGSAAACAVGGARRIGAGTCERHRDQECRGRAISHGHKKRGTECPSPIVRQRRRTPLR